MCEVGVSPDEPAGEIEDLTEQADDIADQSQGVGPEDDGKTLLGSGQEDQDDEQDNGRPKLAAIVDANADAVLHEVVHQNDGHIELAAAGMIHGDALRERVEVRSQPDRYQKIDEFRNAGAEEANGRGWRELRVPEEGTEERLYGSPNLIQFGQVGYEEQAR